MHDRSEDQRERDERLFALLLTALYAWLVLGTLRAHEPFRDEAQAWLIGRDASLSETLALLRYQGHPALWYLLVRPLARLGLPYETMGLLHISLAIGSAFLVLRFAPLPRLTRALFVFSFWMFWMYAVQGGVYAVSLLLLFLIAWRYPDRHGRPWLHGALIALLFNSSLHMAFVAGALTLAFAWEAFRARAWDRRHVLAVCIMAAGVLALLWQFNFLRAPADSMHGGRFLWFNRPVEIVKGITTAFFFDVKPYELLAPSAIVILLWLFYSLVTRPIPLLLFAAHVAGQCLMLWLVGSEFRHHGLILVGSVFALWIAHEHADSPRGPFPRLPDFAQRSGRIIGILNVCLVSSVYAGWQEHRMDRAYDFSGTRRMAEFIIRKDLARYPIAAHRYMHVSSIAPYFPGKQFWYIGIGEWVTFVRQDAAHSRAHMLSNEEAVRMLSGQATENEPFLLLTDRPLQVIPPRWKLLYQVDERIGTDEKCYLYIRGGAGAPTGIPPHDGALQYPRPGVFHARRTGAGAGVGTLSAVSSTAQGTILELGRRDGNE